MVNVIFFPESELPFEIVGTYEINTTALEVYHHNFHGRSKPHNIMGLTVEDLMKLNPRIIMMSPPCQPFTRSVDIFLLLYIIIKFRIFL